MKYSIFIRKVEKKHKQIFSINISFKLLYFIYFIQWNILCSIITYKKSLMQKLDSSTLNLKKYIV